MCGIGMKICVWCSGSIEEQGVEKVRLGRHSPVHMQLAWMPVLITADMGDSPCRLVGLMT